MTQLDINSIAIIGAGPAGIASLYEFLHTNKDGTSTVGTDTPSADPKFSKVVAFEQKNKAGGVWAPSLDAADYRVPPQHLLDTEDYHNPDVIHPGQKVPGVAGTADEPLIVAENDVSNELLWKRSGLFPSLFTNVPYRFTRFSYQPIQAELNDPKRLLYPFLTYKELVDSVDDVVQRANLESHIRLNTAVENVVKNAEGKWVVTVRKNDPATKQDHWYSEEFDAVVISNGHYTVPYFPHIDGLAEFNKKYPDTLLHAKSYRTPDEFKDKSVLVVGGSISSVNIVQHVLPVAKLVTNSKRGPHPVLEFVNEILVDETIVQRGPIDRFDAESGNVVYKDGTAEKYDKIVLTTGYHYHYPFLHGGNLQIKDASHASCVRGLYQNTFSIDDPTLGTVGVAVSPVNFHTIEASAAALAGVWSGAKSLPSREEQRKWEQDKYDLVNNPRAFHFYEYSTVKEEFVDQVYPLAPVGRYNPLEYDHEHLSIIGLGYKNLVKFFDHLKNEPFPDSL